MSASPPRSKSRVPLFSKAERPACWRNTAAALVKLKAAPCPRRRPTSASTAQSGRASPGALRKRRWREMRRSEFVTVPSFSPQARAGSRTVRRPVARAVSESAITSETT